MAKKTVFVIFIIPLLYIFLNITVMDLYWHEARAAVSAIPFQLGLKYAVILPCFTTGKPPTCEGGPFCFMKDAGSCSLYSDVSGTMAGGMGSEALFLKTAIAQAGAVSGADIIAGGMERLFMDNGILASRGGCAGCTGLTKVDRLAKLAGYFNRINNFIVSIIKI
jgi:hypothetical protein